jgi:hypothetical protein
MPRTTKAQREAEDRLRDAFDRGSEYWAKHPDEFLATVHRVASAAYHTKEEAFEFVGGYTAARRRHDDYLREKGTQS